MSHNVCKFNSICLNLILDFKFKILSTSVSKSTFISAWSLLSSLLSLLQLIVVKTKGIVVTIIEIIKQDFLKRCNFIRFKLGFLN